MHKNLKQYNIKEHISHLRAVLLAGIASYIAVTTVFYIYFSSNVINSLLGILSQKQEIAVLMFSNIEDAFFVRIKTSIFLGCFLSVPIFKLLIYIYCHSGLYKKERTVYSLILCISTAITVGSFYSFQGVVLPAFLKFFIQFKSDFSTVKYNIDVNSYINFTLKTFACYYITLQIPIFLIVLTRLKIIKKKFLINYRKHFLAGSFILGGILTPPDPMSQIIVGLFIYLTIEISILLS